VGNFIIITVLSRRGGILLTSFNNSTLQTPVRQKHLGDILYKPSYCLFCVKFRCVSTEVIRGKFQWRQLDDPKNYTTNQNYNSILRTTTTGVIAV